MVGMVNPGRPARVIDQHIQLPESLNGAGYERRAVVFFGDVALDVVRFSWQSLD